MPKTQSDPIQTFAESPYGYWVLSSRSLAQQEVIKQELAATLEEERTKLHLERGVKSVKIATERKIEDWKENYNNLKLIADLSLSSQEESEKPKATTESQG